MEVNAYACFVYSTLLKKWVLKAIVDDGYIAYAWARIDPKNRRVDEYDTHYESNQLEEELPK